MIAVNAGGGQIADPLELVGRAPQSQSPNRAQRSDHRPRLDLPRSKGVWRLCNRGGHIRLPGKIKGSTPDAASCVALSPLRVVPMIFQPLRQ